MEISSDKLSRAIIGKAMEVHRELGPSVNEYFDHELMVDKLTAAGIEHDSKPRRELVHKGQVADIFEPDIVVGSRFVLELKWLWGNFAPEHFVQTKCYLKFWRIPDALLFDFGKESLIQRRYFFTDQPAPSLSVDELLSNMPATIQSASLARRLGEAICEINGNYGLGYRDTTYRGLLCAELLMTNTPCVLEPLATIRSSDRVLGTTTLGCMAVANQCAVMVLALRNEIRAADRARLQSALRHLGFDWGLVVNFGKKQTAVKWVSV
jgi:GxxExxY protein